jgi:hypothetical protein
VKNVAPPTDVILTNGFVTPSRTWITVDNTASNGDAVWVVSPSGIKTGTYAITAACATGFEINVYSATTQSVPASVKYKPGNNYLKYRNLYRVGDTSEWSLVAQVPITEGTFDDSFSYQNIEGGTPDSFYQEDGINIIFSKAPPALTCLTSHYGMLFGISGHTIRWTPIGRPDAWPEVFSLTMPFQPLALASFNQALIVLCYDAIYRLDGNVPTRISLSKTKAENGCIAPHSVQKTHSGLVYLSKLGPMLFDGERAVTITATKIPAQFFQGTSYRYSSSVEFWARPTLSTYNYVNLCNHDGLLGKFNTNPMVETNPRSGPNYNVRSFYSNGKYSMFWVDGSATNYTENTMVTIDLQVEEFPVTTSSVKLLDAFVSDTCNTYTLLRESSPGIDAEFVPPTFSYEPIESTIVFKSTVYFTRDPSLTGDMTVTDLWPTALDDTKWSGIISFQQSGDEYFYNDTTKDTSFTIDGTITSADFQFSLTDLSLAVSLTGNIKCTVGSSSAYAAYSLIWSP